MERVVTALLELSLPMAAVIALLLAAGPLLGRRFAAKWRWWAWLLLAVRLLVPVEISLPQPVLTLPQPQAEITYTLPQKAEPILPGERFSETPLQVLPGGEEALPSAQRPYEQLAQDTPQPVQTPQAAQAASTTATVKGGWLRLRAQPSFDAVTITSYYSGTVVTVLGTSGKWYQVTTPDGRSGYMYGDYLTVNTGSSGGGTPSGSWENIWLMESCL